MHIFTRDTLIFSERLWNISSTRLVFFSPSRFLNPCDKLSFTLTWLTPPSLVSPVLPYDWNWTVIATKYIPAGSLTAIFNRPAAWSAPDVLTQQNLSPELERLSVVDFFVLDLGKKRLSCCNLHLTYHDRCILVCVILWTEELIVQYIVWKNLTLTLTNNMHRHILEHVGPVFFKWRKLIHYPLEYEHHKLFFQN